MTHAGIIAAGVPRAEADFMGAEMRAAMEIFKGSNGDELERRAREALARDLPPKPLMIDAAAISVREAREMAKELGLAWPKREDFQ